MIRKTYYGYEHQLIHRAIQEPIGLNVMIMENKFFEQRRKFFELAGVGLLTALVTNKGKGAETCRVPFKTLDKNIQIDVGHRGKEIIEKAYRLGHDYEKKHGGCCRCTVAALQNAIEFIPKNEAIFRTACCLDGGATPTGIQNCGAFTGAGIIIGYLCGTGPFGNTRLAHKLIRAVYERFKETYESVLCKDVRNKGQRNCPEIVARASRWTAEAILSQFTNYSKE